MTQDQLDLPSWERSHIPIPTSTFESMMFLSLRWNYVFSFPGGFFFWWIVERMEATFDYRKATEGFQPANIWRAKSQHVANLISQWESSKRKCKSWSVAWVNIEFHLYSLSGCKISCGYTLCKLHFGSVGIRSHSIFDGIKQQKIQW